MNHPLSKFMLGLRSGSWTAAVALATLLISAPAFALIIGKRVVFERIEFGSGQFPFSHPPAIVTLTYVPPLGAPTALTLPTVFHEAANHTYVEGSGSMDVGFTIPNLLGQNTYYALVAGPPATHLLVIPTVPPALPARLRFSFLAVFKVGPQGHPAHAVRLFYPIIGVNNAFGSKVIVDAAIGITRLNAAGQPQGTTLVSQTRLFPWPFQPIGALNASSGVLATQPLGYLVVSGYLNF
jgi:hypothetical protein